MYVKRPNKPIAVRLPNGELLSRSDLPPTDTVRWVARRKLTVVKAVLAGLVTQEEVEHLYKVSKDEFAEWEQASIKSGLNGLKVTSRTTLS